MLYLRPLMHTRMAFILLLWGLGFSPPAHATWPWRNPFGLKPLPCNKQLLLNLYRQSGFSQEVSPRTFLKWVTHMPTRLGLPPALVANRYKLLADRPDLTNLMSGLVIKQDPLGSGLRVSGGWGNDYTFLPNLPHWRRVTENFGRLVVRLTEKRGLDPILAGQIFVSDHTSIGDSGWVMATTEKMVQGKPQASHGSVKITYAAQDSAMRTRLLEVTFNSQKVKEIHIMNKTSSFLSSSSENLLYLPMRAYVIKTSTENRFFGGNDFSTMGQIVTKEKKYF